MLNIKNIYKSFGSIKALSNVSFSLQKGDIVILFGDNGAGKSTLMKIIAGVLDSDEGMIEIFGFDNKKNRIKALENIGYMPENMPLYQDLSVLEFLTLMAKIKKAPQKNIAKIINKLSLKDVINQKIETLSKGYKSRALIAQALLNNPKTLILDEPTEGLDPSQKKQIRQILKDYAKQNIVLISTHIIEEAKELNSKVLVLKKGALIANTSVSEIIENQKDKSFANGLKKIMENKK